MDAPSSGRVNRLDAETSAYLRQHRHNPVDWHPWGPEAFEIARREDKPVLVSIGYSACHWCHVMAHESFEDPATAERMNALFVNVKVDREERPDVDQIYMDTVVRLTGHGGWPLTVFCLPDGRPFYGGTYYPPEPRQGMPGFPQVLQAVEQAFRTRRGEMDETAGRILAALRAQPSGVASEPPGAGGAVQAARELLSSADRRDGGFGAGPKFPTPTNLDLLLAASDVLPDDEAADALGHVVFTCHEMSRRGLYDQVGGGFHRYTVDGEWIVPHFEKMLYDQGQLLRTYAEAWRRGGGDDDDLVWPIRETAAYLEREMAAPDGGFFASQDADSEGKEGIFYVWTPPQVGAALGAEAARGFCAAYGVDERGNFEHGTTILVDRARAPRATWAEERAALYAARTKRVPPGTDTKRVTAWNALAASGLCRAGSLLGDEALVTRAAEVVDFLLERVRDADGRPLRVFDAGGARIPAFLDDVAALLEASLDLHRAGAGERYLADALRLAEDLAARFFDETEGDLFLTPSDGERLVHRPRSDHDGATPHSTGQAALGLLRVATLTGRAEVRDVVDRVLRTHAFALERVPHAYPTLLRAALGAERGLSVAVIVGDPSDAATAALAARARRLLGPDDGVVVVAPGTRGAPPLDAAWLAQREPVDGRPTAYVCRGVTCSLPVTEPDELAPLPAEKR